MYMISCFLYPIGVGRGPWCPSLSPSLPSDCMCTPSSASRSGSTHHFACYLTQFHFHHHSTSHISLCFHCIVCSTAAFITSSAFRQPLRCYALNRFFSMVLSFSAYVPGLIVRLPLLFDIDKTPLLFHAAAYAHALALLLLSI